MAADEDYGWPSNNDLNEHFGGWALLEICSFYEYQGLLVIAARDRIVDFSRHFHDESIVALPVSLGFELLREAILGCDALYAILDVHMGPPENVMSRSETSRLVLEICDALPLGGRAVCRLPSWFFTGGEARETRDAMLPLGHIEFIVHHTLNLSEERVHSLLFGRDPKRVGQPTISATIPRSHPDATFEMWSKLGAAESLLYGNVEWHPKELPDWIELVRLASGRDWSPTTLRENADLESLVAPSPSRQDRDIAGLLVHEIEERLSLICSSVLKRRFGEDNDGWWARGIPLSVRAEAAKRREEDPMRLDPEAYLDFIDYRAVLAMKPSPFNEFFAAHQVDKTRFLNALEKASKIRNRAFHATRHRHDPIRERDVAFLREFSDMVKKLMRDM